MFKQIVKMGEEMSRNTAAGYRYPSAEKVEALEHDVLSCDRSPSAEKVEALEDDVLSFDSSPMTAEEMLAMRDEIMREKKIIRNMFLVYTALISPSSDIAIPVVKCVEDLQKNIRRMIIRNRFTKSVVASKKIQNAFRRHSAVSKWLKRLADVPERTVGALFSSLAEARAKMSANDHYVASLQSALQNNMMNIIRPVDVHTLTTTRRHSFFAEVLLSAGFKSMKDAVKFL